MEFLRQLDDFVWCKQEWNYPTISDSTRDLLKQSTVMTPVNKSFEVEDIIKKSQSFSIHFPIQTVRLEKLKKRRPVERLKNNILSTYPLIHERVIHLMTHFLIYKRTFGSRLEKTFYKYMTVPQLIDRILKFRAISFMYPEDHYKLLSGATGEGGWDEVGTANQKRPLLLENCMSYDEMKISALVCISGYTECINEGSRHNSGVMRDHHCEHNALIIGMVGPRFERLQRMDYEDIIISDKQNIPENGYGEAPTPMRFAQVLNKTFTRKPSPEDFTDRYMWRQLWAEFYGIDNITHEELATQRLQYLSVNRQYRERFVKLSMDETCEVFDNVAYYRRLLVPVECALLESEWRAREAGRLAYLNVVGCGLGVWKISLHQTDLYVLTFMERIHTFLEKNMLNHVSDVNFAYLRPTQGVFEMFTPCTEAEQPRKMFFENSQHPKGGIAVHLNNREPCSKLEGEHEGKLLVLTYPWDGNAFPGNEFWLGYLTGSGDPAAACSTQVAELQNAHINPVLRAASARVAGRTGLEPLQAYCDHAAA